MDNTVENIAQEIILDLDNDASLSVSYVQLWLIGNIGKLNNAIGTNIQLSCNDFNPLPTDDQKDILKWYFTCRYYANLAKNSLGAAAYDFSEVSEGDSTIRKVSKNEIAKTYNTLAKQCEESLKEVIKFYRMNNALPRSQSSFDTPMYLYSRVND